LRLGNHHYNIGISYKEISKELISMKSNPIIFETITRARLRLLDLHYRAHSGHVGGNFSCIDALITLHHEVMTGDDAFVLSKGHAAGALYITLWSLGRLSEEDLETFSKDDSRLPGHPSARALPDVMFSTGSLGHGPSLAAGLALAAKHKGLSQKVFCLCSDGEWQEGSCWEALIFATHQKLDNLIIMIDQNGWQGFGRTEEVISCSDLSDRIASFGAHIIRTDGHNPDGIANALRSVAIGKPVVVILQTIKGNGLPFEDTLESHYLPLTEAQYACARASLENGFSK
jgi:transketolase